MKQEEIYRLLNIYKEWCDENKFYLHKRIKKDIKKIPANEFNNIMKDIKSPDDFMNRFFIHWDEDSWCMINDKKTTDFHIDIFEREILNRYYTQVMTCFGCLQEEPNQFAHMGPGGCLQYEDADEEFV